MGTLALIVEERREGLALSPGVATQLSRLGITRVSMLREGDSVAVVLEGWAFDPDRSGRDAQAALLGGSGDARLFLPVAQVNLAGDRAVAGTDGANRGLP